MKRTSDLINGNMIAPCGMNCSLCIAFQREKNRCPGCRASDEYKSDYCRKCIVKDCDKLNDQGFCIGCEKLPCRRIKQLDKRYTGKYGMSMIGNLAYIEKNGLKAFIDKEKERWRCSECGHLFSVHREACQKCGNVKPEHLRVPEE